MFAEVKKIEKLAQDNGVQIRNIREHSFADQCYELGMNDVLRVIALNAFVQQGNHTLTSTEKKLLEASDEILTNLNSSLSEDQKAQLREFDDAESDYHYTREKEEFVLGFMAGYKYLREVVANKE